MDSSELVSWLSLQEAVLFPNLLRFRKTTLPLSLGSRCWQIDFAARPPLILAKGFVAGPYRIRRLHRKASCADDQRQLPRVMVTASHS